MARLKAYNQIEIVRVGKDFPGDGNLTIQERKELAIFSNGRMLERRIVEFKTREGEPRHHHDYGWKVLHKAGGVSLGKVRPWVAKRLGEEWEVTEGPGWHLLPPASTEAAPCPNEPASLPQESTSTAFVVNVSVEGVQS